MGELERWRRNVSHGHRRKLANNLHGKLHNPVFVDGDSIARRRGYGGCQPVLAGWILQQRHFRAVDRNREFWLSVRRFFGRPDWHIESTICRDERAAFSDR